MNQTKAQEIVKRPVLRYALELGELRSVYKGKTLFLRNFMHDQAIADRYGG